MNTTTRTALRLLIATPLAASAVVIGGYAGVAHADTPAFDPTPGVIIAQPEGDDPKPQGPGKIAIPKDDEDPKPQGPGDIANPEPGDDPKPEGPGDITNPEPGDDPGPQIPGDKVGPNPGDKPDVPGDDAGKGGDKSDPAGKPGKADKSGKVDADKADNNDTVGAEVQVPNRIDAGTGPVDDGTNGGLSLAWVLAGGGVVTAVGSAFARRRLATNR